MIVGFVDEPVIVFSPFPGNAFESSSGKPVREVFHCFEARRYIHRSVNSDHHKEVNTLTSWEGVNEPCTGSHYLAKSLTCLLASMQERVMTISFRPVTITDAKNRRRNHAGERERQASVRDK